MISGNSNIRLRRLTIFAMVIVVLVSCSFVFTFFFEGDSKTIHSRKKFLNNLEFTERSSSSDYLRDYGDTRVFEYETCLSEKSSSNKRMVPNSREGLARFNCTHLMTISGSQGGRLGNFMFPVASLIGVASWHGYTPVVNEKFPLFSKFDLINSVNFTIENLSNARAKVCCKHDPVFYLLDDSKNWSLSGMLQSWKYFDGAEQRVRKAFTFKIKYKSNAMNYLDSVRKENVVNVCVHVRRGDIVKNKRNPGYAVAPVTYIQRAMQFCRQRFEIVQFIFVSNDIKWCKNNFNDTDNYFSPFTDPVVDMALLASCDHVIITSGTFGWWGAWLAGGTTIYYRGHPKAGSRLDSRLNASEYYPKNWIGMD